MSISKVFFFFIFLLGFFWETSTAQQISRVDDGKLILETIQSRSFSKNLSLLATKKDSDVYSKVSQVGITSSPIVIDYFKMAALDPRTREIYVHLTKKSEAEAEQILLSQFRESFKAYKQEWNDAVEKDEKFDDQVIVHGLRCLLFLTEEFCSLSTFDKLAMEWHVWDREMKDDKRYRSAGPGNLFLYNLYVQKFARQQNYDEFPLRRMFAATLATITKERFKDVYKSSVFEPVGFKIARWYEPVENREDDQKDTSPPFVTIDHQAMGTLIFLEEPTANEAIHSIRSVLDSSLEKSGASIRSLKKWLEENAVGEK